MVEVLRGTIFLFLLWLLPMFSVILLDKYHWFHSNIDPIKFKGCSKCDN